VILRDLAAGWVRVNCPRFDVQENFLQYLDNAIRYRVNCSFMIGRDLIGSGKPFLVCCFCGEFFAFELTPPQAAQLQVTDKLLVSAKGVRQYDQGPKPPPTVSLEHIKVNQATALDRSSPISGTLRYRTDRFLDAPLAIRVVFEPPGRSSHIHLHHLLHLPPPEGTLPFSVSPFGELHDQNGRPYAGILPLFFQIWTTGERPTPGFGASPFSPVAGPPIPRPSQPSLPSGWQPIGASRPSMPGPIPPMTSPYPPSYDPMTQVRPPTQQERSISDIRAVLVEVV
jgi:hypothetical protein